MGMRPPIRNDPVGRFVPVRRPSHHWCQTPATEFDAQWRLCRRDL